jgi:hypothetical protein
MKTAVVGTGSGSCRMQGIGGGVAHVDGVRLRLWTAATNGPIVHP